MSLLNYVHKSPHRNQLEDYLKVYLPELNGPVLDIGSKNRRYDELLKEKPVAIDTLENKAKEVQFGDILNLSFSEGSFTSVICFEVLEYVSDINKAISEVNRILNNNGTFIFSTPFLYRYHQDKIRYTKMGLAEILVKYFTRVEIYPVGNFYTIILDIIRGQIIKVKFKPLRYFYYVLYLPWVLFIPLSKFFKDDSFASGYFVIAKK